MKQSKRLALRRESMTELRTDELGGIAAAGFDLPPSVALCAFSQVSCSVCSVHCGNTFTCPPKLPEVLPTALPTN